VAGLIRVLARSKPRAAASMDVVSVDENLPAERYRDAALFSFMASSPWISSASELERIAREDSILTDDEAANEFILRKAFPHLLLRASSSGDFTSLALRAMEMSTTRDVSPTVLLGAVVESSRTNAIGTGDVIGMLSNPMKIALFECLEARTTTTTTKKSAATMMLSKTKTMQYQPFYSQYGARRNVLKDEFAIRSMDQEQVLTALVQSGMNIIDDVANASVIGSFARAIHGLLSSEDSSQSSSITVKRLRISSALCEPSRIGRMISSTRQEPGSLARVCALFNRMVALEQQQPSAVSAAEGQGLSIRSRILLGAISGESTTSSPPVMLMWEALLASSMIASSSSMMIAPSSMSEVVALASAATGLLLDSLDDEELFYVPRAYLPVSMMERIILFLKSSLYEALWVKSFDASSSSSTEKSSLVVADLFHQLYSRCARHPDKIPPRLWLFPTIPPAEFGLGSSSSSSSSSTAANQMRFTQVSSSAMTTTRSGLNGDDDDDDEQTQQQDQAMELLTAASPRGQSILRHAPMCVPFEQRVALFHRHLERYKAEHRDDTPRWNELTQQVEHPNRLLVRVRRGSVVQDAFEQLGGKDLSGRLQVSFVNDLGLEEAGIDGGGLFKEFITQFCVEAFDPDRSPQLFQRNPKTQQLFPTMQFSQLKLLEFVGKVLGKAVYENVLVDPEIAPFVLNVLRGTRNAVHDLQSLDADLYRNLLSLKRISSSDLASLQLAFTVTTTTVASSSDQQQPLDVELFKDGRNVLVTKENVSVYVEMVANFRLNRERMVQMDAFARGFHQLIDPAWIRLFSANEFAMLIGGSAVKDFDVGDLRRHVAYGGGYHPSQPYVQEFWDVVANDLTPVQRGKLLKFITSCSRPPLTGFGSLNPLITVYQVREGGETRLPTASTCVNLLKLPKYPSREVLRDKLVLAIESDAGFELS